MSLLLRGMWLALASLVWLGGGGAEGQERIAVTVRQLFDLGHRLEVTAWSEVVWADPHFGRVWFPPGPENPKVERVSAGSGRCSFSRGPIAVRSRSRPGTRRTTSTP